MPANLGVNVGCARVFRNQLDGIGISKCWHMGLDQNEAQWRLDFVLRWNIGFLTEGHFADLFLSGVEICLMD